MDLNQVINDLREKLAKAESERDDLSNQVKLWKKIAEDCAAPDAKEVVLAILKSQGNKSNDGY